MGRWGRNQYERVLYEKTSKLYGKVIDDILKSSDEDADLRWLTFLRRLDPEDKAIQACFSSLVQHAFWEKKGYGEDDSGVPRVTINEATGPEPRPRRRYFPPDRIRSPFPAAHATRTLPFIDRDRDPRLNRARSQNQPQIPTRSQVTRDVSEPSSRARSPSARRRSLSPPTLFGPPRPLSERDRDRAAAADELPTLHPPVPTARERDMDWMLVDFLGGQGSGPIDATGDTGGNAESPPHSPSRAWLSEYTTAVPNPSTNYRRIPATTGMQTERRTGGASIPSLGGEVRMRSDFTRRRPDQSRTLRGEPSSFYEDDEERPRQRRRLDRGDDTSSLATTIPSDAGPSTLQDLSLPRLRRSRSSWRDAPSLDALRDAARSGSRSGSNTPRDTRRDGIVFEPLSPALPSSALSATSGADGHEDGVGLFGLSSHLAQSGHRSMQDLESDMILALGEDVISNIARDREEQRRVFGELIVEAQGSGGGGEHETDDRDRDAGEGRGGVQEDSEAETGDGLPMEPWGGPGSHTTRSMWEGPRYPVDTPAFEADVPSVAAIANTEED